MEEALMAARRALGSASHCDHVLGEDPARQPEQNNLLGRFIRLGICSMSHSWSQVA